MCGDEEKGLFLFLFQFTDRNRDVARGNPSVITAKAQTTSSVLLKKNFFLANRPKLQFLVFVRAVDKRITAINCGNDHYCTSVKTHWLAVLHSAFLQESDNTKRICFVAKQHIHLTTGQTHWWHKTHVIYNQKGSIGWWTSVDDAVGILQMQSTVCVICLTSVTFVSSLTMTNYKSMLL